MNILTEVQRYCVHEMRRLPFKKKNRNIQRTRKHSKKFKMMANKIKEKG